MRAWTLLGKTLVDTPDRPDSQIRRDSFRIAIADMTIEQLITLGTVLARKPQEFVDENRAIRERIIELKGQQ